jgi:hypothetical protein
VKGKGLALRGTTTRWSSTADTGTGFPACTGSLPAILGAWLWHPRTSPTNHGSVPPFPPPSSVMYYYFYRGPRFPAARPPPVALCTEKKHRSHSLSPAHTTPLPSTMAKNGSDDSGSQISLLCFCTFVGKTWPGHWLGPGIGTSPTSKILSTQNIL